MTFARLRSPRRHLFMLIALALAACGGASGSTGGSATVAGTPAPTATPTATPSSAPSPTPSSTTVASPTLTGLEPVASGIDVAQYLRPAWGTGQIPGPELGEGAFRFVCAPSHNAYDDPIVYPGQKGRSHLHTFFGNTKADADSTYASLRTTGDSTCNNVLNRSAYWVPAMMNGRGKVVMPDYVAIYYKAVSSTNPNCTKVARACINIPHGLRYIFGYNMSDPSKSSPAGSAYWNCDGNGAISGHYDNIAQAAKNCPVGARLGMVMSGPPCWNGRDLDSSDHRSHLSYPIDYSQGDGVGRCPSTHPYLIPHFTIGVWYTTDATLDRSGDQSVDAQTWYLASDRMSGMANMVPGTTLHSDWFGAWEDSVLKTWFTNCIEKELNCSGGDLGNGQQMTMLSGYNYENRTILADLPNK